MKRNLMKRAHQIAKSLEGNYQARMSLALRQVWKEEKGMGLVEKLIELGGNRWQKGGHDRIYLDSKTLAEAIGLEAETYKTGNICSATLKGEKISNSEAGRIYGALGGANLYYDCSKDKFFWRTPINEEYIQMAIEALRAS